jgi:hypothetical protein
VAGFARHLQPAAMGESDCDVFNARDAIPGRFGNGDGADLGGRPPSLPFRRTSARAAAADDRPPALWAAPLRLNDPPR